MTRSRLKNRFHRIKTQETHTAHKVQRNICTRLLRKSKRSYYNNVNTSVITNNKMFWKTVKPLFSNNSTSSENIIVIDKNEIFRMKVKLRMYLVIIFLMLLRNSILRKQHLCRLIVRVLQTRFYIAL